MSVGRNDLCPCRSGKKYKRCCGARLSEPPPDTPEARHAHAAKAADVDLAGRILRFARGRRGGEAWLDHATDDFTGSPGLEIPQDVFEIALSWMLYHRPERDDGATIAHLYLEEQGHRLTPQMRAVLEAHLVSWISLWEVREVVPGVGERVSDLLTGEERFIYDVSSSRMLSPRLVLLGRVVDCDGVSFFGGVHSRPLEPMQAQQVAWSALEPSGADEGGMTIEQLRNNDVVLDMIDQWDAVVAEAEAQPPPTMTTTEGDLFEITADHFDFDAKARDEILQRLSSIPGAVEPQEESGETSIAVLKSKPRARDGMATVIGRFALKHARLSIETFSRKRADKLKSAVEKKLGDLVRYRLRESTGVEGMMERARQQPERPREPDAPELQEIKRQLKERHMQSWVDESIPALGGLTPRQASASTAGRKSLELLLREIEYHEGRLPEDERFDMSRLRVRLGMTEQR